MRKDVRQELHHAIDESRGVASSGLPQELHDAIGANRVANWDVSGNLVGDRRKAEARARDGR